MTTPKQQVANLKAAFREHNIPWPLPEGTSTVEEWEEHLKALDVAYRVCCEKNDGPVSVVALQAAIEAYNNALDAIRSQ